ncbi:exported protein of unknown function [Pseudorhizobium banfieldiae]|uniref:Uncharacterized protein n=1 Tax=Pseudorhizobium banfieldiae TaxID=1125847 RepID=L0NE14_9HYPH|nr:transglutaminase-like cysteine peptidase [Pseudorhizobium banfieldiae]CAD6606057.1 transglutaminase [arsenite-oxidising bacterium NT-25]CCF19119.1 exported protein of unknown function [Pseudorhizobium banfieldiae]
MNSMRYGRAAIVRCAAIGIAAWLAFGGSAVAGPRAWYYTSVYTAPLHEADINLAKLEEVNKSVNGSMVWVADGKLDTWTIGGRQGDCDDFAVTKLDRLVKAGIPVTSMRLGRGKALGQKHMVLIVFTTSGWYVLDNLSDGIYRNRGRFKPVSRQKTPTPIPQG